MTYHAHSTAGDSAPHPMSRSARSSRASTTSYPYTSSSDSYPPSYPYPSSSRRTSHLLHELQPPPRRLSTHQILLLTPFGAPINLPLPAPVGNERSSTSDGSGYNSSGGGVGESTGMAVGMTRQGSSMGSSMGRAGTRMGTGRSSVASSLAGSIPEEGDAEGNYRSRSARASSSALAMSRPRPTILPGYAAASSISPTRPSPLAISHPMSKITFGSDDDRTLSAGNSASQQASFDGRTEAPTDDNEAWSDTYHEAGLEDDPRVLALSLATTVPMTRYNSLPVLTLRELDAMKEKDAELGIERGGDWAWVSSAPGPAQGGAQTAGPGRRVLYPWEAAEVGTGVQKEALDGARGALAENVSAVTEAAAWAGAKEVDPSLRENVPSSSSTFSTAHPQTAHSYSTSGLSLSNPILIGFSDPFAHSRGDAPGGSGTNADPSESRDATTQPKPPQYRGYGLYEHPELRRHTYDPQSSYSQEPMSTQAGYRYSFDPEARRMSEVSALNRSEPSHNDSAAAQSLGGKAQTRRPSAPVSSAHSRSSQQAGTRHRPSGSRGPLEPASDGPSSSSRIPEHHYGNSNQQESPKGTRTRIASMDRPRILRYKTSPARFTGLGLNIVVNAGPDVGGSGGTAAASGAGEVSTAERRARRHARLRAKTPQDSPGGAPAFLGTASARGSEADKGSPHGSTSRPLATAGSGADTDVDADATPLSAHPAIFESQNTPQNRLGSWSRVGVVDRLQVDLPAYSSHSHLSDADLDDLYPPPRSSLSVSARDSLSSASDTWSALMAASRGLNTPASVGPSTFTSSRASISIGAMDADVDGDLITATTRSPRLGDGSVNVAVRNVVLLHTTRGMSLPEMTARRDQLGDVAESMEGWKGRGRFDSLDSALPRLFAKTGLASWFPHQEASGQYTQQSEGRASVGSDKGKGKGKARSSIFEALTSPPWDMADRFETFPRRGSAATVSLSTSAMTGASGKRGSVAGLTESDVKREWYKRRGSWAEGWKGPT